MSPEAIKSISTNNRDIHFREIHHQFSQTPEGKKLANKTRFSKFQNNLDNESWQKILGYDVNNLEHNRLSYETTRLFIKDMNSNSVFFTPKEEELLLLTSIIHDYPEGFTIKGDIHFSSKTKADEKEELFFIDQIIHQTLGKENQEISTKIKDILDDKKSKLGQAFNAIERLGYTRTALIAQKKSKNSDPVTASNLNWLTYDVFSNQIPELINYSLIYKPIHKFLKNKSDQISQAFITINSNIINLYPLEKQSKQLEKMDHAIKSWNEWISINIQ